MAASFGADAIGLNFYSKSPRYVLPKQAEQLIRVLPPFVAPVGVFVGGSISEIDELGHQLGLQAIQHYADEQDEFEDRPTLPYIAAYRVKDRSSLDEIDQYLTDCENAQRMPAAILVDAHVEGQIGGTGRTAPWKILENYEPAVPLILAGGLTPENVAEAIQTVGPYAVDVASGVESAPGRKNSEMVRRFIENARAAVRTS